MVTPAGGVAGYYTADSAPLLASPPRLSVSGLGWPDGFVAFVVIDPIGRDYGIAVKRTPSGFPDVKPGPLPLGLFYVPVVDVIVFRSTPKRLDHFEDWWMFSAETGDLLGKRIAVQDKGQRTTGVAVAEGAPIVAVNTVGWQVKKRPDQAAGTGLTVLRMGPAGSLATLDAETSPDGLWISAPRFVWRNDALLCAYDLLDGHGAMVDTRTLTVNFAATKGK